MLLLGALSIKIKGRTMKSALTIDELFEIEGSLAIIEKMERRKKQRDEEARKDKELHDSAKRRLSALRAKEKKE